MGKHKQYTDEFKHEALRLAQTSGKSISELERDLNLSAGLLRQWQRRYQTSEASTTVEPSPERQAEAEIRRLKRELEIMRQERDILKKAITVFSREQPPVKYRFIAAHRAAYPVEQLCRVLGVSRSGYYAWQGRAPSVRAQQDALLAKKIAEQHTRSRATYGSRRLSQALRAEGVVCSRARAARLLREQGLQTTIRRAYKVTTRVDAQRPVAPNLLNREFTATRPNEKWVTDFTYIPTRDGWLYLAIVLDLFSRQIVGWSMSNRQQTTLVADALRMALARRCPSAGLLHHSDRGSQYTSSDYQALLAEHEITVSMSRTGEPYDNAVMESFFATLKAECATTRFPSRDHARAALFDYIEVWYNRQRLHSALGYRSPAAFEHLHAA